MATTNWAGQPHQPGVDRIENKQIPICLKQPRKTEDVPDYKVPKVWDRLPDEGLARCFGQCGLARIAKGEPSATLLVLFWAGESLLSLQNCGAFFWVAGKLILACSSSGLEGNCQSYVHKTSDIRDVCCLGCMSA